MRQALVAAQDEPAWVRPVDIYSFAAAIHPQVSGNRYDGKSYKP